MMKYREDNMARWLGVRPAHRGEEVFIDATGVSAGTDTIYTVGAGKILFITDWFVQCWSSTAASVALRVKDLTPANWALLFFYEDDAAFRFAVTQNYTFPWEIAAGFIVTAGTSNATSEMNCSFHGWTEDA